VRDQPDETSGRRVVVGLVGKGIQASRTPAMHEAEGRRQGFHYMYQLLDTARMGADPPSLSDILRAAELCGFSGLNITFPFKREVVGHVDDLSETARDVGAVNTVVFREGRRFGHNTDKWAFAESFRRTMADVEKRLVLLIGAGGAGSAVAHALLECGVGRLTVHDIMPQAAADLASQLCGRFGTNRAEAIEDLSTVAPQLDGLVNASPVGMAAMPGTPFPTELLSPRLWVADIVYFPMETELLGAGRERGCRTLSGAGMAVFQAARSFELFTGVRPDAAFMKATFDAFAT
jgi:shikimate dehydrogenase